MPTRMPNYQNRRTRADHGDRAILAVERFHFEEVRVLVHYAVYASQAALDAGAEPLERGRVEVTAGDFELLDQYVRRQLESAVQRRLPGML